MDGNGLRFEKNGLIIEAAEGRDKQLMGKTLTNHDTLQSPCSTIAFIQSPSLFPYLNHSLTAHGSDLPFFFTPTVSISHE